VSTLATGVPIPWARSGPADFTPLLAMVVAVLVLRFVIRAQLTAMSTMLALAGGAFWAYSAERWGIVIPSVSALLLIARLRISVGRARSV